jgi:hypothetical protein
VADSFADVSQARSWLHHAGEPQLGDDLGILNQALHAFRLVTGDPYLQPVGREQLLVARVGFGPGEAVADGLWTEAHELSRGHGRRRRSAVLEAQTRLAAVLTGREPALICEELALRARLDLDHDRTREGALQLLVALDAALAELAIDATASVLADRLAELRGLRDAVAAAAATALAGPLSLTERGTLEFTVARIEAALRARTVALS